MFLKILLNGVDDWILRALRLRDESSTSDSEGREPLHVNESVSEP